MILPTTTTGGRHWDLDPDLWAIASTLCGLVDVLAVGRLVIRVREYKDEK